MPVSVLQSDGDWHALRLASGCPAFETRLYNFNGRRCSNGNGYVLGWASVGEYAGGSAEVRTLALQKANGHRQSLTRQLKVLVVEPAAERTNVTFQCLMSGDPRLVQPLGSPTINVNLNQGR